MIFWKTSGDRMFGGCSLALSSGVAHALHDIQYLTIESGRAKLRKTIASGAGVREWHSSAGKFL